MDLSLLAPGLVGLVVAASAVLYAYWIARCRNAKSATPAAATAAEDDQIPFEFTPPTVLTVAEGSVRTRLQKPESVH